MDGFLATYWSHTVCLYLFHLRALSYPHPTKMGEGVHLLPPFFGQYGAVRVVAIALVRAVTAAWVRTVHSLPCATGHNWSARKSRRSVGLLRDTGDLVTKDMTKVQELDAFFA